LVDACCLDTCSSHFPPPEKTRPQSARYRAK
jgi:hypothetical protein